MVAPTARAMLNPDYWRLSPKIWWNRSSQCQYPCFTSFWSCCLAPRAMIVLQHVRPRRWHPRDEDELQTKSIIPLGTEAGRSAALLGLPGGAVLPSALGVSQSKLKAEPGLKEPRGTGNCCLSLAPGAGSTPLPSSAFCSSQQGLVGGCGSCSKAGLPGEGCGPRHLALSTQPLAVRHTASRFLALPYPAALPKQWRSWGQHAARCSGGCSVVLSRASSHSCHPLLGWVICFALNYSVLQLSFWLTDLFCLYFTPPAQFLRFQEQFSIKHYQPMPLLRKIFLSYQLINLLILFLIPHSFLLRKNKVLTYQFFNHMYWKVVKLHCFSWQCKKRKIHVS